MPNPIPLPSIAAAGDLLGRSIAQHLERTFRAVLRGKGVSAARQSIRLVTGQPHPFGNFALISADADRSGVEAEIDVLGRLEVPAAVLFVAAVAPEIEAHLRTRGFEAHAPMPAMAVEIDRLKPTSLPPDCELIQVGIGPQGAVWEEIFAKGYGLPQPVAARFSPNQAGVDPAGEPALQFFMVVRQGRALATSALYLQDGLAGIYCVATLPDERGKGLGAHVTAEPLRRARALGYRVGILQASEDGEPVYQRLGFAPFGSVPLFVRLPGKYKTPK